MKRSLGESWPLPRLDAHNRDFFTAGVLTLQQCSRCRHIQHPPEDVCEACGSFEFGRFVSAGKGRIESVAVVTQAVHPLLEDQVPYAIVLVSIADAPGLLIAGNVVEKDPNDIGIGDAAQVVFVEVRDARSGDVLRIPHWRIDDGR